ncbi:MAG: single-stranded-DNA-specific exonuclease RecJ [Saccharofermentanales bacterium]
MLHIRKKVLEKRKWYQNPMTQSFNQQLQEAVEISISEAEEICFTGLLEARGLYDAAARAEFLNPLEGEFFDPFLFKEMLLTCEIISESLFNQEKIIVYGDYDCDGLTATAIMVRLLRKLNTDADVEYMIPDRLEDGYGLSDKTVDSLIAGKADLVITVDCGINDHQEIARLMQSGIKVIVTDHHQPDNTNINQALAVLNPQSADAGYPFAGLSGAGVAFKLAQALVQYLGNNQIDLSPALCLAAVGTVADSMPLESENRILVALAISIFREKASLGLRMITEKIINSPKIDTSLFSFSIGPRLNAAGRMGNIKPAITLLLSDQLAEIEKSLAELEELNDQRKELEQEIFSEAIMQIENMPLAEKRNIIIIANEKWHTGIVGIVSSRLAERYAVPVITFAGSEEGLQGSARSVGDFDILAAIDSASEYTVTYGGHLQAAGVTVESEQYPIFRQHLLEYASANPIKKSDIEEFQYQYILPHSVLTENFAETLTLLEPYGQKNEKPSFVLENLKIEQWRTVGQGKHVSLTLRLDDDRLVSAIAFNAQDFSRLFRQNDLVDLLVYLNWQEWNNRFSMQLQVLDWVVPASDNLIWQDSARIENTFQLDDQQIDNLLQMYGLDKKQFEISNDQIIAVTRYIQQYVADLETGFNLTLLARAIAREMQLFINPFILTRIFSMLEEIGFVETDQIDKNNRRLRINNHTNQRKSIQNTETWRNMNAQELMLDVRR